MRVDESHLKMQCVIDMNEDLKRVSSSRCQTVGNEWTLTSHEKLEKQQDY